jgi:hypothetical protein
MKKDKKFVIAAVLALLVLVPASSGFGVNGAIFKEEVSPGQDLAHKITVSNIGENTSLKEFTASIYGFARTINGVNIEIPPEKDTGSFTARPFLTIEPDRFSIEPNETKTLFLNGTVPEDVGSGGRYAIAAICIQPDIRNGVAVLTEIQIPVYLTIKDGELIKTGIINSLNASKNNETLAVDITFENTGNVHYKPLAEVTLKDQTGQIMDEKKMDLDKANPVLPKNSYLFKMKIGSVVNLDSGTYTIEAKVTNEDGIVLDSKETEIEI